MFVAVIRGGVYLLPAPSDVLCRPLRAVMGRLQFMRIDDDDVDRGNEAVFWSS